MTFPLQQIDHKHSPYERPNQKWECGWRCEGKACDGGPDAKGRCQAHLQTVCEPRKNGDRWECARLPMYGGACELGPGPDGSCCRPQGTHPVCQPRRRLRARRGRLVAATCMLTVGLLAFALAGPWSLSIVNPGKLSQAHAGLDFAAVGAANQCAICHTNIDGDTALGAMLSPRDSAVVLADSQQCATCHFEEPDADSGHVFMVHSADPDQIAAATRRAEASETRFASAKLTLAALAPSPLDDPTQPMACQTCHQEHHGVDHDLTFMSTTSCQVCHTVRFESFAVGHPAFHEVPKPPGIQYDHLLHRAQAEIGNDCSRCHETNPNQLGRLVGVKPFAQSCAECHADDMQKLGDPLDVVKLPVMETEAEWWNPDSQMADEEEPLPLLMFMLLYGDDQARPVLNTLFEFGGFEGVVEFDLEEPEEKDVLAAAIKRLLEDLAAEDPAVLRTRLHRALNLAPDQADLLVLADQLHRARFTVWEFAFDFLEDLEIDEPSEPDQQRFVLPADEEADPSVQYLFTDPEKTGGQKRLIALDAHADPLIVALLDTLQSATRRGTDSFPSAETQAGDGATLNLPVELFAAFSGTWNATCLSCHSVGDTAETRQLIWAGPERSAGFAKFDHATHVPRFAAEQSCTTCHQWPDEQIKGAVGLVPVANHQCSSCHAPDQPAGDACTTCHDYHFIRPLRGRLQGR